MTPTLTVTAEDSSILHKAFVDLDAANAVGLITDEEWTQAVDDVYSNPKAVDFFLKGARQWSHAGRGRGLANYLRQYHTQDV